MRRCVGMLELINTNNVFAYLNWIIIFISQPIPFGVLCVIVNVVRPSYVKIVNTHKCPPHTVSQCEACLCQLGKVYLRGWYELVSSELVCSRQVCRGHYRWLCWCSLLSLHVPLADTLPLLVLIFHRLPLIEINTLAMCLNRCSNIITTNSHVFPITNCKIDDGRNIMVSLGDNVKKIWN